MNEPPILILIVALVGYLLGAISFATLIARAHGVDIFAVGSGNPGATNVLRSLGKKAGYATFLLDALKGLAAAAWPVPILGGAEGLSPDLLGWLPVVGCIAAIVGHSLSPFIGFRGGKGVATTIGGLLAINPLMIGIALLVWLAVFYSTRYVSLASILLGLSLPVVSFSMPERPLAEQILVSLIALLITVRHKKNIQNLLRGTEHKFVKKSQSPESSKEGAGNP